MANKTKLKRVATGKTEDFLDSTKLREKRTKNKKRENEIDGNDTLLHRIMHGRKLINELAYKQWLLKKREISVNKSNNPLCSEPSRTASDGDKKIFNNLKQLSNISTLSDAKNKHITDDERYSNTEEPSGREASCRYSSVIEADYDYDERVGCNVGGEYLEEPKTSVAAVHDVSIDKGTDGTSLYNTVNGSQTFTAANETAMLKKFGKNIKNNSVKTASKLLKLGDSTMLETNKHLSRNSKEENEQFSVEFLDAVSKKLKLKKRLSEEALSMPPLIQRNPVKLTYKEWLKKKQKEIKETMEQNRINTEGTEEEIERRRRQTEKRLKEWYIRTANRYTNQWNEEQKLIDMKMKNITVEELSDEDIKEKELSDMKKQERKNRKKKCECDKLEI